MHRSSSKSEPEDLSLSCDHGCSSRFLSRRTVLKSALGVSAAIAAVEQVAHAQTDPKKARPQVGDFLVFALGDRQGQRIAQQDIPLDGPPVTAYAQDPTSQVVRDGSRLNRVLLVRLQTNMLSEQTRTIAADGIVGYSAVCTHTGCDVVGWEGTRHHFICPCHTSTFDATDRARVVSGPAPKPLAALPLQIVDGAIAVAGAFTGRVGAEQK